MEITIGGRYINPHNCRYSFKLKKSCPFHEFINVTKLEELDALHKIVNYIQNYFQEFIPIFWQSFDKLSAWRTLKNINLLFRIIWLLGACANWIVDGKDEEYTEFKIGQLQKEIFETLSEGKFDMTIKEILKNHLSLFLEKCHWCQCYYKISLPEIRGIGNRYDLVEKLLLEDGILVYDDFNSHIQKIFDLAKNQLRRVSLPEKIKKELGQIPKNLWTQLFKSYSTNTSKTNYVDPNNNLVNVYQYEDSSESDEDIEPSLYSYGEEKDPEFIYEISFENQSYCVLCDEYERPIPIPPMYIIGNNMVDRKKNPTGPRVCTAICNSLVYYYNEKVLESGYVNQYKLNFGNFRYAKNRMMEFYTGCADGNSELAFLDHVDVKKYIILMFLDLLMFT
jgi:hypothetical protein